jgi:hypothetical protein
MASQSEQLPEPAQVGSILSDIHLQAYAPVYGWAHRSRTVTDFVYFFSCQISL